MKWVTDLNINYKTVELLEDNIGENLSAFRYGDVFLDSAPEAQAMKERIGKLDLIKIKNYFAKDHVKRMKR